MGEMRQSIWPSGGVRTSSRMGEAVVTEPREVLCSRSVGGLLIAKSSTVACSSG